MAKEEKDYKSNSKRTKRKGSKGGKDAFIAKKVDNDPNGKRHPKMSPDELRSGSDYTNDPRWYMGNSALSVSAGNINFFNPIGVPYDLNTTESDEYLGTGDFFLNVPGHMAINVSMTGGGSSAAESILNQLAIDQYANEVWNLSWTTDIDPNDLFLYNFAMAQPYFIYGWLCRLYGCLRTFSAINHYAPKVWVQSMGVNFDDVIQHTNDLYGYIRAYRAKLTKYAIPATIPWFQRAIQLFTNIFLDGTTSKSQTILLNPATLLKLDTTSQSTGTSMASWDFMGRYVNYNYQSIITLCDSFLDTILNDQDIGKMSAIMIKAYGAENCAVAPEIPIDYQIVPVYDPAFLMQIANMRLTGKMTTSITQVIPSSAQSPYLRSRTLSRQYLISDEEKMGAYCDTLKNVMISHNEVPDTAEVMENRTYMFNAKITEISDKEYLEIMNSDFVIPETLDIYTIKYVNGQVSTEKTSITSSVIVATDAHKFAKLAVFKEHPMFYIVSNWNPDTAVLHGLYADLDNYVIIDDVMLDKMHRAAKYSQFKFPLREY